MSSQVKVYGRDCQEKTGSSHNIANQKAPPLVLPTINDADLSSLTLLNKSIEQMKIQQTGPNASHGNAKAIAMLERSRQCLVKTSRKF